MAGSRCCPPVHRCLLRAPIWFVTPHCMSRVYMCAWLDLISAYAHMHSTTHAHAESQCVFVHAYVEQVRAMWKLSGVESKLQAMEDRTKKLTAEMKADAIVCELFFGCKLQSAIDVFKHGMAKVLSTRKNSCKACVGSSTLRLSSEPRMYHNPRLGIFAEGSSPDVALICRAVIFAEELAMGGSFKKGHFPEKIYAEKDGFFCETDVIPVGVVLLVGKTSR
uniref:Uncharacterized protein n=1 Tax=Lotharella globosa TaxID=91324 RepID=A0A7S3ZAE3_9EUKA